MARDGEFLQEGAQRTPVSAHSAFPWIVGLWFAALLGLGTIVMPAVVLEPIVSLTGLGEPPLTAAARAVFALAATVLGLVGGLALARRVTAAQQVERAPRRRRAHRKGDAPPRPLSVHDDLGEEAIAPTAGESSFAAPRRRRALAVPEDPRPSDFLMAAPLPGAEPEAAFELPPELSAHEDPMSDRPSDFEPWSADIDAPDTPVAAPGADAPAPYVPELDTRKPRDLAPPSPAGAAEELVVEPIDAPLEDLGIVQLAERLGRSMQRRLAQAALLPDAATPASAEPEALEFSAPSFEHEEPEADTVAVPPPVVPEALRAFMDVAPETLAPPQAAAEPTPVPAPPPVVPAALRPFAFDALGADEEDEDDLDPGPFTLPLAARPFETPDAEFADEEDEAEEPFADDSYSSLLAMKNPFRAPDEEFVRIDEPERGDDAIEPAVVFPGHESLAAEPAPLEDARPKEAAPQPAAAPARPFDAPHQPAPNTAPVHARKAPDPVETERALRSALANLQRMSGAA